MEIKILKTDLIKTIQTVQNIISTRSNLPILANILIEAGNNNLTLTTTDLDIGIISTTTSEIEEEGALSVPAKRFNEIIKELPEEEVLISTMKNNSMVIKSGKCFFKILGLPKEEFPKLPEFINKPQLTMEQSVLKNMLNMTHFSISHDETRYILNGALFLFKDNKLTIVTTDGKRLSLIKGDVKENIPPEKPFIVPAKTVYELIRILKDENNVEIVFNGSQVKFRIDDTIIISRLIEGEFPNYEQVIPKESKEKLTIQREEFLFGVRRASLLTTQDSQSIKIDILKNKIIISKSNPNIGEAREEIEVAYKGPEMTIGFNPVYLMDVLKVLPRDELELEIFAPDKPAVIRIEDWYIYLVLPMQLG